MTEAHLNFIGTATPSHDVHFPFIQFARTLLKTKAEQLLFDRMAERSRIKHRYSVLAAPGQGRGETLETSQVYKSGAFPSTAARMRLFEEYAPRLAQNALEALTERTPIGDVAHLIVTSCTGFYALGLDHQIAKAFGLSSSVERTMVGFMGCSAGVNALKLARHVVRSEPSSRVLVVNLELCSLHLQEVADLERVLSFLLFGDGCAASLVTADEVGISLDSFYATTIPDTAELITWRVGDSGFEMNLSARVPSAIAGGLDSAASKILRGALPSTFDRWAVHPGGRSILEAVERGLGLAPSALEPSWKVLARHGNMSSATISFVLESVMADAKPGERGCAMAFGPGLCAETMLFHTV